ncbi:type I restriction endonuclease subunit S [Sutcliffiella horikoshii]|uniref:Type I restriction endonuclease subunit S n=1 Tax=Sutcliffiella horikoshii TaxID=79883 RepID=A0ABM6KEW0_9BACI|nr:restriction endonuclease subunit S [Sutcliffiella horikoshii]ART74850.1 type I restriction endonuclease subunit S [Sutcliffiella horikoshii]
MKSKWTPEVRFPEFSGDWEQQKLGDIANFFRGNGYSKSDLTDKGSQIILYGRLYTKYETVIKSVDTFTKLKERSVISKGNEVIIPSSGETSEDISRASFVSVPGIILGGDLNIVQPSDKIDPVFLALTISNGEQQKELSKRAQGKSVVHLHNSDLKKVNLIFPEREEQTKIGNLFKQLDDTIAIHQQELTTLKQTKQGFLQKLFPKEGESVPEVRFPGFTGEWEQCKLREMLAEPVTDGPHETPKLEESGIPFISVDAIVDNQIDFDRKRGYISEETDELYSKKYRPQYHDVFLVKSGSTVGKTAIVETKERFNIWSPLAAMRVGEVSNPYFLYFLLQTRKMQNQVKDKASSGTQPNLGMRELEKFHTQITPNLEEQKKIGAFFQQLDNLITLHQRELEALKKTKKAFLQKMFV